MTLAGSLKANIGVVTPSISRVKQVVVANRDMDGTGVMNSWARDQILSRLWLDSAGPYDRKYSFANVVNFLSAISALK